MASRKANGPAAGQDLGLATRAAWMHLAGGMTQSEVADRLGITRLKAHRLIALATREGLIRVFIDGEIAGCVQLEATLSETYGLGFCQVVPNLDDDPLPLKPLGMVGAQFLRTVLERGEETLIGVGHGRTLAACVEHLMRLNAGRTRFVSLLGGLTRSFAANPHDVIHRLADRTGAQAYVMPVPFIANTVDDRAVLMAQKGVGEVFDLARKAGLLLVGLGSVERQASLVATGMVERAEMDEVRRAGACGEILGHFFARDGSPVDNDVTRRTITLSLDDLRGRRIVAIAGGTAKTEAVGAVLASGLLQGLITDERTAAGLAARPERRRPAGPRK
ncbi:MAG: sugar-binding transcriptional regulator [Alphaproteobacteria bacterium]|nr:sugar-binding transcriptional regulator [Alphaproteobacteria bacterium]